jgi:MFS family permease
MLYGINDRIHICDINDEGMDAVIAAKESSYKSMQIARTYSRILIPVIASAGAVGLSLGLTIPLTSIVLEQRGISIVFIGLNATVYSLAVLLTGPFLPNIIHRVGLLKSMFAGALLSGVFVIGLAFDDSLGLWYLLRFCMGVAGGIHWVASEAWINEMAPAEQRGRVVGAYATIWSMGIAGGPLILRFIGVDGPLPFIVSGCLMAAAALPLLIVPEIENSQMPPTHQLVLRMVFNASVAMAAGFFSGFLETAVLALLPVYGLHSGVEAAYALMLVSLFAVGSFAVQPIIGWIADKVAFKTIAISIAIVSSLVVPFLPFYLHLPVLTGVLLFIWGGSVGGYYTVGMINVGQCFKGGDLTAASSMFVMAYTVGMVLGPLFCSASMQFAGPSGLLILPTIVPLFFVGLVLKRDGARPCFSLK